MSSRIPLTVVIAARDEARQIGDCVRSASFAAEVLVVENDSRDETRDVAAAAGATVFSHPFSTIGNQRNAAIQRALHPWILVLDADERASSALGDELGALIASPPNPSVHAYRVRRRNVFLGKEIQHGGWERDHPVRFFSRDLRYNDRAVHEHVVTSGPVGELRERITHEPYESLAEYFEKLIRYGRGWAAQQAARGRTGSLFSVVFKPPARFFSMLVLRAGFLDGARGVILAALAAMSVATKYAFLWELGRRSAPGRGDGT
ncbi:MAG: glycosyltransferase family 2 protein [Gemmatimonadaceae bacterium]